jgi:hypothetical protein
VFHQSVRAFVDGGDGQGGLVADGEFVVPGGGAAVAFERRPAPARGTRMRCRTPDARRRHPGTLGGGGMPERPKGVLRTPG